MASNPKSVLASTPNEKTEPSRAIIFDFDGTLVNSYPIIDAAFAHVMAKHNLDERAREEFMKSRGFPLTEQMRRVNPDCWEDLVRTYREADVTLGQAHVFRGVPSLVQRLHAANSGLAVVSCKLRALVEAELDAAGLRKYFDVVIGFEDVDPPKPAPEPLLEAMNRLGTGRANTLYVGDSMVDLQAGQSARIKTVLAAWGLAPEFRASFKHHKLWAVHPSRLLELALSLPTPNGNGHRPLPNGHRPLPSGDNRAA